MIREIESVENGVVIAGEYKFETDLPAKIGDLTDGRTIMIPNRRLHPDMPKHVVEACKNFSIKYLNENANTIFHIKGKGHLSYWRNEILIRSILLLGITLEEIESLFDFGLTPLEIKSRLTSPISLLPLSISSCKRVAERCGGKFEDVKLGRELRNLYRKYKDLGSIPGHEHIRGMNTQIVSGNLLLEHQRRFRDAIISNKNKIECIYGPAGSGKTTKLVSIKADYYLAFTGKAVDRIKEVLPDKCDKVLTIHSFLGKQENVNILVLDEASMVNSQLLSCLLKRCMRLICIGDPNQLQPIGVGAPFTALLRTNVKKTRLMNVYRNKGSILSGLLDVLKNRLPQTLDDSISIVDADMNYVINQDAVIITPFRKEVNEINERVFPGKINVGMNVIVTKNSPTVFNGMIGTVEEIEEDHAIVDFGERVIPVHLEFLEKAAAITVHKSQGSEFERVVFYLPRYDDFVTKELVYTAMSRAKQKLTVVANSDVLLKCIQNASADKYDLL